MSSGTWIGGWDQLRHVLLVGTAAYVTLVLVLRVSGKRTLAKLNAFDLVVTVALGSTLASTVVSSSVSWLQGALAFAVLAGLQFGVAEVSRHLPGGRSVVTARPTLLLRNGRPLDDALREQRITHDELRQAVRSSGSQGSLEGVAAVVLETDGSLSVVPRSALGDGSALAGVQGWEG